MSDQQSPICEICMAWMLEHPENKFWLKCVSCGFCKKISKTIIYIVGGDKNG